MSADQASIYNPEEIAGYFDELGRGEWERLTATPVDEVSLYIHTHYLKAYVPAGARVLEIGAGAGRFTQILAEMGARIVVGDISPGQLALNKRYAQEKGFAHAVEAWHRVDVSDMAPFAAASFDCVVAYGGPLSYVMDRRDAALAECKRVLKPGGGLLLSVMSLWGGAHRHLDGVLAVPTGANRKITDTGDLSSETLPGRDNHVHLFRAAELRAWLRRADLSILALSASNFLSLGWEGLLEEIRADEEKWGELLRMELEACAEEGSLNTGTHLLAVARKG